MMMVVASALPCPILTHSPLPEDAARHTQLSNVALAPRSVLQLNLKKPDAQPTAQARDSHVVSLCMPPQMSLRYTEIFPHCVTNAVLGCFESSTSLDDAKARVVCSVPLYRTASDNWPKRKQCNFREIPEIPEILEILEILEIPEMPEIT